MAEKRMFSLKIVDSDRFLDLPPAARLLYFELGVRCDDDGFCACPGKILRMTGAAKGDLTALIEAGLLLDFGGVVVLRDWRVHNCLRRDRLRPLTYPEIAKLLWIGPTGRYERKESQDSMNLLEYRSKYEKEAKDPIVEMRRKSSENVEKAWYYQDKRGEDKRSEDRISEDKINEDKTVQYSAGEDRADETALGLAPEGPDGFGGGTERAEESSSERLEPLGGELGQNVLWLTDAQMTDLLDQMSLEEFQRYTRRLSDYILQKGDRFHSHYRTILKWWEQDKAVEGRDGPHIPYVHNA